MSTRSAVGTIDPSTGAWRGRYVHSDGYPSARVPVLRDTLNRRDGDLAGMLHVLTEEFYGWSFLTGTTDDPYAQYGSMLGERGVWVSGFGTAYTTAQGQSAPDDWITGEVGVETDDPWIEWVYLFTSTDVRVAELVIMELRHIAGLGRSGPDAYRAEYVEVRRLSMPQLATLTDGEAAEIERESADAE